MAEPKKILIVDDDPANRKMLDFVFSRKGWHTISADNGVAAINALRRDSVDLVVMDLQMPIMDGWTATRNIRIEFGEQLPIIGCSTLQSDDIKKECWNAGMNFFVAKPVDWSLMDTYLHELFADETPGSIELLTGNDLPFTDMDYLQELSSGDKDFQLEMIQLYLQQSEYTIDQMEALLREQNLGELKLLAHRLKSPATIVGARRMHTLLDELEYAELDTWQNRNACKELRKLNQQIISELNQYLNNLSQ